MKLAKFTFFCVEFTEIKIGKLLGKNYTSLI